MMKDLFGSSPELESQLEIVLERDGVPISVAPKARTPRQKNTPTTHDAEADRLRVEVVQARTQSKKPKAVAITREAHEPSRFVVRMDGLVAKLAADVRDPFHRRMHEWQTPMVEQSELGSVFVHAVDLWIEDLDPKYFHAQFTPGDEEEAYRESQKGIWTTLRKPFIRWTDRRSSTDQLATYFDQVFDKPTDVESVASTIEFMPEIAAPVLATEPKASRPSLGDRLMAWRERIHEQAADAREAEQELVAEVESTWETPYLQPKVRVVRVMLGFLGMFCLIALPAGAVSWSRSVTESIASVETSASALNSSSLSAASNPQTLTTALLKIGSLANDLEQSNGIALGLAQAIPTTHDTAQTVQALLDIAQEGSQAGSFLSQGATRAMADDVATPDERLVRFSQYLEEARPHLDRLFADAHALHPQSMPENLRDRVQHIQEMILSHQAFIEQADALTGLALQLIGHNEQRTYLVLFQNQTERRPSGGFMGSYAEVILDRGMIHKLSVPGGGSYDLRSQLLPHWTPPAPIQLVDARWEFQDANWSPDFSATADTVRTFWSHAGQPTLDGVIAINASILPKLLTITGPIEMKAYNKTITSDNVILETQKAVEIEYDHVANTPKAFIGDLNHEVLTRLQHLSQEQWLPLASILVQGLETKEIQVHLFRENEQAAISSFGWTGEWPQVDAFDQLAVIGANVAGQKSDAAIKESVLQAVTIDDQGFVQSNVTLHREHQADPGQLFYGANNVQYLRLYTPPGTTLLNGVGFQAPSSSFFQPMATDTIPFPDVATSTGSMTFADQSVDLLQEQGRQVFGGWIQLKPGMTRETIMSYRLAKSTADMARALTTDAESDPSVTDAYVVHLISQSGADREHRLTIQYPTNWTVVKTSADLQTSASGTIVGDIANLNQDRLEYVLFKRGQ